MDGVMDGECDAAMTAITNITSSTAAVTPTAIPAMAIPRPC